jgi:hypothetical protein
MEEKRYSISISTLERRKWLDSCSGRLRERVTANQWNRSGQCDVQKHPCPSQEKDVIGCHIPWQTYRNSSLVKGKGKGKAIPVLF